jgi:DNA-binding MarR family transcriptional regulator
MNISDQKRTVLKHISDKPYSVNEMTTKMGIDRTQISSILTFLERLKLLSVSKDKNDGRRRIYSITDQGKTELGV